uniref:Uncharacterized protein n=1 Tax=Molossus molossus TaxID=27622 RepID=A0A7J8GKH9_MOLMO|nr:hypothetical protein HJG59_011519 [Molossus molossus]
MVQLGVTGQEVACEVVVHSAQRSYKILGAPSPRPTAPHLCSGQEVATELHPPGRGAQTLAGFLVVLFFNIFFYIALILLLLYLIFLLFSLLLLPYLLLASFLFLLYLFFSFFFFIYLPFSVFFLHLHNFFLSSFSIFLSFFTVFLLILSTHFLPSVLSFQNLVSVLFLFHYSLYFFILLLVILFFFSLFIIHVLFFLS